MLSAHRIRRAAIALAAAGGALAFSGASATASTTSSSQSMATQTTVMAAQSSPGVTTTISRTRRSSTPNLSCFWAKYFVQKDFNGPTARNVNCTQTPARTAFRLTYNKWGFGFTAAGETFTVLKKRRGGRFFRFETVCLVTDTMGAPVDGVPCSRRLPPGP